VQGEEEASSRQPDQGGGIEWLGIQYQDLSSNLREGHNIPRDVDGVIVTSVAPTSPLYEQFVRPGSIITEVNGRPVKDVDDFEKTIQDAKSGSYLRFYAVQFGQRGERQPFFAVVQVP
jgi:serine protease Do